MANRPHVPKFGDWTEDAPFTVVFEKASKSKKNANMSNPNEYPEMNPNSAQTRNHRHDQPPNNNVRSRHDQAPNNNVRSRHERYSSREEIEFRPHQERNNRVRAPPTSETNKHQSLSETRRRQQHDPAPVQRPIRNLRGRSNEKVATIPPFPISGSENQSYTLIFDKVKEDRNQNVRSYNGTPQSSTTRPINDQHHQPLPSSPKGCCFPPWG